MQPNPMQTGSAYGMKPQKLSWVTIPLIVNIVLGALSLISLPLIGSFVRSMSSLAASDASTTAQDLQGLQVLQVFTGGTLWIIFVIGLAWLVFEFFTLRAVQAGKSWGRVAAIVIFILSLLNFPLGTILGIFGLIGAFDPEVQRYATA